MRGNAHVRFGGRAGETGRSKGRNRASVRPYYEKVRQGARIVSQAAVVAVGVRDTGEKSVLGLAIGASETEAFWLEFCRSLSRRGLSGVQLVISDAHEGLRSALSQVFAGATWQRCKVHYADLRIMPMTRVLRAHKALARSA